MIDILVPAEQEGTTAVVRSWLRKVGEAVAEHDPLVELETDKVTQEISAPAAGVLVEILLATDAEATPGAILGRISSETDAAAGIVTAAAPSTTKAPELGEPPELVEAPARSMAHVLSPSVRRMVEEYAIDPSTIAGTGRDGRVTRVDIDLVLANRVASPQPAPTPSAGLTELPPAQNASDQSPGPGGVHSVPHTRMRLAIANNMLNSVTTAPHVTSVFEADFSAVLAHRKRHKAAFEQEGASLTFTAYVVAACVTAMRTVSTINSRWHADRLDIIDDINIGVGTALGEKGLVVPVIHQAQNLSLLGIARRLNALVIAAREGKLAPADTRGGTFTISNHGVSGSLLAVPIIIAQPQSGILGVGKLEKRVVVREVDGADSIQIRPMCYVSLTIDHRVVDAHQTNTWLASFVAALEHWPINNT